MMAPLVAQMDEGTTPIVRAFAIFRLSKLRASTLIRLRALCALKGCAGRRPMYIPSAEPKSHYSRFPRFRRIQLAEPRAGTVLLLRDGLACCRLASRREWVSTSQLRLLHSVIARDLAKVIVESCDDGDASCGSLVEAEGMLREVLPLVDLIEDDSWKHDLKASILEAIAELLEKQGRHEEALRAKQDLADLLQEHDVAPRAARRRRGRRRGGRARGSRGGGV